MYSTYVAFMKDHSENIDFLFPDLFLLSFNVYDVEMETTLT